LSLAAGCDVVGLAVHIVRHLQQVASHRLSTGHRRLELSGEPPESAPYALGGIVVASLLEVVVVHALASVEGAGSIAMELQV
jgi:hypothetical protein